MRSIPTPLLAMLPLAAALACGGAQAQDLTLAGLAAQVKLLNDEVARLRATNELLVTRLGCVLKYSGARDFVFEGCNVHVRNGAGATGTTNRYGNLIIGYNKNEVSTRTGSHNLVLGDLHEYTSYGGIVSGSVNTLAGPNATILSSVESGANAGGSTIIGASRGVTDGNAVLLGGVRSYASVDARFGAVVGGTENRITGAAAVAVGGTMNAAAGGNALACGGSENSASGSSATACGGSRNQSTAPQSTVTGGTANQATGRSSLVTGGQSCVSGAIDNKWVAGAQAVPGCSGYGN